MGPAFPGAALTTESQAPRRTRHAGSLGTEVSREEPHTPNPLAKALYIEYLPPDGTFSIFCELETAWWPRMFPDQRADGGCFTTFAGLLTDTCLFGRLRSEPGGQ